MDAAVKSQTAMNQSRRAAERFLFSTHVLGAVVTNQLA